MVSPLQILAAATLSTSTSIVEKPKDYVVTGSVGLVSLGIPTFGMDLTHV